MNNIYQRNTECVHYPGTTSVNAIHQRDNKCDNIDERDTECEQYLSERNWVWTISTSKTLCVNNIHQEDTECLRSISTRRTSSVNNIHRGDSNCDNIHQRANRRQVVSHVRGTGTSAITQRSRSSELWADVTSLETLRCKITLIRWIH